VRDNGIGPFDRIDERTTLTFGLHLVRILVKDRIGYTLTIQRRKGSAFRISSPHRQ
jgi:two-component sensor histidine kinase